MIVFTTRICVWHSKRLLKHITNIELHTDVKTPHIYRTVNSWKSKEELVDNLLQNVVYNKDGLICINKPYGVGSTRPASPVSKPAINKINTALLGETDYYMSDVLPELAKHLKCKNLQILKMAQRHASGIAVLSSKKEISARVMNCRLRAQPLQRASEKYWVITDGVPLPKVNECKVGVQLEKSTLNENKHPTIVEVWTKSAMKRGEVKVVQVSHRTLYIAPKGCASFVEVCTTRTKWNFLRVYFSWLMSPILGDNIFSSRVRTVLNRRIRVHPDSDSARLPQNLSEEMLSRLRLHPGQEVLIPAHVHLRELTLVNYLGKNKDLVLTAPVPEIFSWTCAQIGMDIREDETKETDSRVSESVAASVT